MGLKDRLFKRQDDDDSRNSEEEGMVRSSGHDVFISYSTKDKHIADKVCNALEQNGVKCWIAPRDIRPGENYVHHMSKSMKSAKIVVLIFSRYCMESKFVINEIEMAFDHEKPIISFKIDETMPEGEMEFLLKDKYWLDAYPSPESMFEALAVDTRELIDSMNVHVISH